MDDLDRFILEELRLLRQDVQSNGKEIAALKVKASVWGALSGFLASLGAWFASNK